MNLAVYGTLRRGNNEHWTVEGFSLVFPGSQNLFQLLIKNKQGKGAVVEVYGCYR